MAVTNEEIIARSCACKKITEVVHTYESWRSIGRQVKKGEHALLMIPIWKMAKPRKIAKENTEGEKVDVAEKAGYFYLKNSAFFGESQTEPITETANA